MSQSTAPLPEANKLEAGRQAMPYLDSEKEKQNAEFDDQSTRAPSTFEAETDKKDVLAEDSGTSTDEKAAAGASAAQDTGDYPSGLKLASIVAALVLSVFLFSLDQVSGPFQVLARLCPANHTAAC